MKTMIRISVFLLVLFTIGCAYRTPERVKPAKKRLFKHAKAIKDIGTRFPELVDTQRVVVIDTLVIEEKTAVFDSISVYDTIAVNSLLIQYMATIDSLKLIENHVHVGNQEYIDKLNFEKHRLINKLNSIKSAIPKKAIRDTIYQFSQNGLTGKISFVDGVMSVDIKSDSSAVIYTKQINKINLDSTRSSDFWEDWKFWLILIILFGVIVFLIAKMK